MTVRRSKPTNAEQTGPVFENPPVVEVALGIQFKELVGFNSTHFGLYFERIRSRFPIAEEQPRIDPIDERFPRAVPLPRLQFQIGSRPNRMWFKDSIDGSRLLQLQPDRFNFNWRKPNDEAPYRPYVESRSSCLEEFECFCRFCAEEGLSPVVPEICEVVYINHLFPALGESGIDLFERAFMGIRWQNSDEFLPPPDVASVNRVFVIGKEQGRLYAETSVGLHKERGEFVILKMTARVNHPFGLTNDVADSLQLGHDWVVKGFVSLTEPLFRLQRWKQKR